MDASFYGFELLKTPNGEVLCNKDNVERKKRYIGLFVQEKISQCLKTLQATISKLSLRPCPENAMVQSG